MPIRKATASVSASSDQGLTAGLRYDQLLQGLNHEDLAYRRACIRELASYPEAANALVARLSKESSSAGRHALFDALLHMDADTITPLLIGLLRNEQASIRNGVVEVLQSFPEAISRHMEALITNDDADVRIFAIDIMHLLPHPSVPLWLLRVVKSDPHVNVVGNALDRLSEVVSPTMVNDIIAVKGRFVDQPFIQFAADICLARISEERE